MNWESGMGRNEAWAKGKLTVLPESEGLPLNRIFRGGADVNLIILCKLLMQRNPRGLVCSPGPPSTHVPSGFALASKFFFLSRLHRLTKYRESDFIRTNVASPV